MSYIRTTDATGELLTVDEAKRSLRLTDDDVDSDEISDYVKAARHLWETDTNVILGSQTWKHYLDGFPSSDFIYIEKYPVTSVSTVEYYDANGTLQTLNASLYWTDLNGIVARIRTQDSWPETEDLRPASVIITFVVGHTASNVPTDILQGLKSLIGHWYANRQEEVIMSGTSKVGISNGYMTVRDRHKLYAGNRNL